MRQPLHAAEAPVSTATLHARRSERCAESKEHLQSWWALTVCLLGVAASAIVMGTGYWRRGAMVFAASVLMAGILRVVLPEQSAGLLAVRTRWIDSVLLLGLGAVGRRHPHEVTSTHLCDVSLVAWVGHRAGSCPGRRT